MLLGGTRELVCVWERGPAGRRLAEGRSDDMSSGRVQQRGVTSIPGAGGQWTGLDPDGLTWHLGSEL